MAAVEHLAARIGSVEAKNRNVAVDLRNTKEQLVIANTKVTKFREEADRYRDPSLPSVPSSSRVDAPGGPFRA